MTPRHLRNSVRCGALVAALACAAGCANEGAGTPGTIAAEHPWPAAPVATTSEPPHIEAVYLSSSAVGFGDTWSGKIATTTNVASVEVRTEAFSIDVPRSSFGQFAFRMHVIDLPPLLRRHFTLRVIARNTAGVADERDFPFEFR